MRSASIRPLRAVGVVATAGILVVALVSFPRAKAATRSTTITFGSPTVVDTVHAYGEPDAKFAPDGTVYDSGPWGTGTQRSIWNTSSDRGRTFHPIHGPAVTSPNGSDTTVPCPVGVTPCPGGGDTEISIDRSGKTYYSDLAALASLKTARWNPATRTLQTGFIANPLQNINGFDRQWFALWDPPSRPAGYTGPLPVNYLLFAEALAGTSCPSGSCESAAYSRDGIAYSDSTMSYDMQNDGPLEIDQTTGTVFQAISVNSLGDVGVAILRRDSATPNDPALKKAEIVKVANLPAGMTTRALFPVIGFDKGRNLYLAWVTRATTSASANPNAWQIFYSYSKASSGWRTWSAPRKISASPANTNIMPWAVAGSSGRLAVAWYGTKDSTSNPSTTDIHQSWDVFVASVAGAASATPTVEQIKVTRHPMHYGTICLEGTGCIASAGNRNLADFFEVTVDPLNGAIVITYNDTSNELLQEFVGTGDGSADHRGVPVVMMVRQTGGIGLFGTSISTTAPAAATLSDPAGDARFDPIYGTSNIVSLDLTKISARLSGNNLVLEMDTPEGGLKHMTDGLAATGATAVDYVLRWTGRPILDAQTGTRNPIYFAAMELASDGSTTFFAGQAVAVELCSVSGCFPHLIDYPAPPRGGTAVSGSIPPENGEPDDIVITVPLSVIGNPPAGSLLESFGAYSFARNKSASLELTTAEGQAGVSPIMVDGVCCIDAKVAS